MKPTRFPHRGEKYLWGYIYGRGEKSMARRAERRARRREADREVNDQSDTVLGRET